MQRKSVAGMQCPIARCVERVGEWWSILILRDAYRGASRGSMRSPTAWASSPERS